MTLKGEEEKKDEAQTEAKEDENSASEEAPDVDEPDPQPPKVELTPEEKRLWFKKGPIFDLTATVHATYFTKFSLPDEDEEARRDRQRRLDLGDKTAALNVQQAA